MNLHGKKSDLIFNAMDACAAHMESKAHDAPQWWGLVQGGLQNLLNQGSPSAEQHIGLLDGNLEWEVWKNNELM